MEGKKPKLQPPAHVGAKVPNFHTVGMDVKWVPGLTPTAPRRRVLNIMDQAGSLQRFIPIPDESSAAIWEAFDKGWRTPYGRPKVVRVDAAKSLVQGAMKQGFEEDGTFVGQIVAKHRGRWERRSVTEDGWQRWCLG